MRNGKNVRLGGNGAGWIRCLFLLLAILVVATVVQAVEVGDQAPDFRLPSTKVHPVSLSGFLGKKNVVLEFYVLDFTPT